MIKLKPELFLILYGIIPGGPKFNGNFIYKLELGQIWNKIRDYEY